MITFKGSKKAVLNCSSFDFLGMSYDESVKQAARDALDHYGCGSCGPRGFYGTIDEHLTLESAIAKFMDAQVFLVSSFNSCLIVVITLRKLFYIQMEHQLSPQLFLLIQRKVIY
jgi:7-keto-8-aminopelargonate synthetase-like enzyme